MPTVIRAFRAGAIAALAGAAIALILLANWLPSARSTGSDVMLLYVGADDCAPCRAWQRNEGTTFRSSAEFGHITYREVKSPALFDILKDEYWPDDLRGYRDRLGRGTGVPLWLVISDQKIVEQRFGASQWQAAILPKIRSLLR